MPTADRLPAVIQAMQDAAREAGDIQLAAALALAVSPAEVAPLLPLTESDGMYGRGFLAIHQRGWPTGTMMACDEALACRVAARLASTACLLLAVDACQHDAVATCLWAAAGRLARLPAPGA